MLSDKLRRQICFDAARLMDSRQEPECSRARIRASRKLCRGWVKSRDLPSQAEIRHELQRFDRVDQTSSDDESAALHREVLQLMRLLNLLQPRLVMLTGFDSREPTGSGPWVPSSGEITIYLEHASVEVICCVLNEAGCEYMIESPAVHPGDTRSRISVVGHCPVLLICAPPHESETTLSLDDFEHLLQGPLNGEPEYLLEHAGETLERFRVYRNLLLPLEKVEQRHSVHPEGDALYHSLQVYQLAREQLPYDEEFLLAALLHDVGKGIDPLDPVETGLNALEGYVTERTHRLIAGLDDAMRRLEGTIGVRARRRLSSDDDSEELSLLAACDRAGRIPGAIVPDLDEALDEIRTLADGLEWRRRVRSRRDCSMGTVSEMTDVTQILGQIEAGDQSAAEQLLPLVYEELRRLAAAQHGGRTQRSHTPGNSPRARGVPASGRRREGSTLEQSRPLLCRCR